jgi:Cu-processing system ATP-binding protein
MTAAVIIERVTKRYGRQAAGGASAAVDDVSLAFGAGQCIALVGHNGAGKTTLIKLLLGLTQATSGRIEVLDEDPLSRAGQRARLAIGYLPENVAFPPSLTGLEMLRFYARLKRRPRAECDDLLDRVGLSEVVHKRIGTYSKGMRQRLGLAQALLGSPRLLLLDEPTTGLDPLLRQSFYDTIGELRARGVTVLLSSHALTELEARVDQVVILQQGRVLASGALDALRERAQLPTRLRLRLRNGIAATALSSFAGIAEGGVAADGSLELICPSDRKLEALRRAHDLAGLEDIEIASPSLDQLYARFLDGKDRPQ